MGDTCLPHSPIYPPGDLRSPGTEGSSPNRTSDQATASFPNTENVDQQLVPMSVPLAPATAPGSPNAPRPPAYSASNLVQGTSSFGFHGVFPQYQPTGHEVNVKREQELKKRRVSESRRQRTPMSCDRCKVRKIKVLTYALYFLKQILIFGTVHKSYSWTL